MRGHIIVFKIVWQVLWHSLTTTVVQGQVIPPSLQVCLLTENCARSYLCGVFCTLSELYWSSIHDGVQVVRVPLCLHAGYVNGNRIGLVM